MITKKIFGSLTHLMMSLLIFAILLSGSDTEDESRMKRLDTKSKAEDTCINGTTQRPAQAGTNHVVGHIGTPIGPPIELEGDPRLEGIAFDEKSKKLYVLNDMDNDVDRDGRDETGEEIQVYTYDSETSVLTLVFSFAIPAESNTGRFLTDGRGLTLAEERGSRILYTLSSHQDRTKDAAGKDNFDSRLWRIDYTESSRIKVQTIDLNQDVFDLRHAEVFDLACDKNGRIYISFDASKQADDLNTQRARGILRFKINGDCPEGWTALEKVPNCHLAWALNGSPELVRKMLPANGKSLDHHNLGLTMMEMDGYEYLIGTVEELSNNKNQEIYVAETEAGLGLFKFDAPSITGDLNTERRLAYGAGVLWVGEQREELDRVQRVVIKDNVYEPLIGYKRPRRIQITITSEALCQEGQNCGFIYHNCGHPLGNDIKPSQGSYFDGYTLKMEPPLTSDPTAPLDSEHNFSYSPMNDPSSLGHITRAQYPTSSSDHGLYKTVFQEDFWTREYRHFVYPHLANNSLGILEDTDFRLGHLRKGDPAIKDSLPRFHWTHQEQIFEDFIDRVKVHIFEKHGVKADLTNPYWAARNVLEYIRDNYNYPDPVASEDGSGDSRGNVVDYDNFHVANGPAVYKMIMTDPRFGDDIRRRRTGCMAAGGVFLAVMRYMGFPARWMGTSQQRKTSRDSPHATGVFYDLNLDGMFNNDDYMDASHGHYTNEVYLGPGYGWQRFDASPNKPDDRDSDGLDYEDFAYLHSRDSQYELMRRKITPGHQPHAVASSLGVGHNEHFFSNAIKNSADCDEKSLYHEATGVYTSTCKGYLSYDFVSIYEHPDKVTTRYDLDPRMRWRPCLTFDVVVNGGQPVVGENTVEFLPQGPWALFESDARVEIVLRIDDGRTITHEVLKTDIAWDKGSETVMIPEGTSGESIHIQVRKIGIEKFIGGASLKFSLK